VSIEKETEFRKILTKLVDDGACGWCALDGAIGHVDGSDFSRQIKDCPKRCIGIVIKSLKEESHGNTR